MHFDRYDCFYVKSDLIKYFSVSLFCFFFNVEATVLNKTGLLICSTLKYTTKLLLFIFFARARPLRKTEGQIIPKQILFSKGE